MPGAGAAREPLRGTTGTPTQIAGQLPLRVEPLRRGDVMTAAEVAELIRVPSSTVYDLARRGVLPGHRVGRAWRFVRPEIEEWLLAS
jgi:excisionase family DNA binding protein